MAAPDLFDNSMNTLLIILKIFPLVLAAVQAVEQAIPLPGQGNKKLELVLDVLKSAYEGSTDLAKQFSCFGARQELPSSVRLI
jgi:hypothetical protein